MKRSTTARPSNPSFAKLMNSVFSLLFLLGAISSNAQNYTVSDVTDGHATNQLRGAIEAADAAGGSHIITLNSGTYNLTLGQIQFGNRAENITITGTGSPTTIINMTSTAQDRIFLINPPGTIAGVITSISGVSFTNGHLKSDLFGGGAILAGGPTNSLTITNCTFSGNTIDATAGTTGGAINMSGGGALSITNSAFSNNTNPKSDGGAVYYFFQNFAGLTGSLTITNSTFSTNTTSVNGGAVGIATQGRITPFNQTFTASIHNNTFTNNTATTGNGGAVFVDNGDAAYSIGINFNRFVGNTSSAVTTSGLAMASASGSVNAVNNWWGCNTGPGVSGTCNRAAITGSGGSGTLDISKWLQLKASASPAALCPTNVGPGNTSLVTASFLKNSGNEDISAADLSTLIGLPISFTPTLGTLSGAQTTIQSGGTATVTFTAGATPGNGGVNAVVDNVPTNDPTAKAAITIYDPAHITVQPVSTTVCTGDNAVLSVTAAGNPAPTYQWRIGSTALTEGTKYQGVAGPTLTVVNAQPADQLGTYNVVVSNACATVTSNNVSVTVNPIPTVNSVSNNTYCAGDNVSTIQFSGSVSGTVFNWSRTATDVGTAASGTGDISAFTAKNSGTSPITATFTVTPTYTQNGVTCTGTATQFSITVNPVPSVDNVSNATYCDGDNVSSIVFTSPVAGSTFAWSRTSGDIGLAATSGTGSIIGFTATNTGTSPIVSTFTVTPSYTNNGVTCTGTAIQFTITVKANSSAPVVNEPICAGSTMVSGTINEADGTSITVYSNGIQIGTGTVSEGSWSATVSAVSSGTSITAKATAPDKCMSTASAAVTVITPTATTTSLSSSNNPSFTTSPGNSVTLTATVTASGNPVTTGTVTFKDGASTISGGSAVALNGSGHAVLTTSFSTEGVHTITAFYNGACPYGTSSGTIQQRADNHTSVNGNVFCNDLSGITINDGTAASPYPSHIFVSGIGTSVNTLKVRINGFTHGLTSDVQVLLVGPHNENLVLFSAAGNSSVSNINLVFDDAAPSALPSNSALVSGTFRPAAYSLASFPSPAPGGPYNSPATSGTATLTSSFGSIDPNGTWSLYVVDANGNSLAGTIASWCLDITTCHIICPSDIVVYTGSGNSQCGTHVSFAATTSGSCGTVTYVDQNNNPIASDDFFPVGITTVTVNAGGSQCSFHITVNDNTPPVISCPANQILELGADCTALLPDYRSLATASDNCPGVTVTQSPAPNTLVTDAGPVTVTLTATDAAGNPTQCNFTVTKKDVTPPAITCPANITQYTDPGQCGANVNFAANATDACGTAQISYSIAPGSFFNTGTTQVTVTATDGSNNTNQCTFNVTITPLADLSITKTAPATTAVPGTDLTYTVTVNNNGGCSASSVLLTDIMPANTKFVAAYAPSGWNMTVPAVGANGSITASLPSLAPNSPQVFIITVHISSSAVGTLSNSATVSSSTFDNNLANNTGTSSVTLTPQADLVITKSASSSNPEAGTGLTYTITVMNNGPSDATSLQLTDIFPVGEALVSVTVNSGLWSVSGTANILTLTTPALSPGLLQTITVSVLISPNLTDGTVLSNTATIISSNDNNTANNSATSNVTVANCVLTCPDNITVGTGPGSTQCGTNVTFGATTNGHCGIVTYADQNNTPVSSGSFFPVGTTTVTATGKGTQCSFTITVNDNTPPTITCPAAQSANADPNNCQAPVPNFIASTTATDNCTSSGSITITQSPTAGTLLGVGEHTITLTATDGAGNQNTCTTKFTVKDVTPPVITNVTVDHSTLWPPLHQMVTVTVNYTDSDPCGTITGCQLIVSSNEPQNGTGDGDTSPDWIILDDHHVQLRAERGNGKDQRVYSISVSCADNSGNRDTSAAVTVTVAHNITGPVTATPFRVGSTVAFSGVFWDKPGNRHTGQWLINDNTTVKGGVTEPSGNKNGKVTGSYKFSTTGIYRLQMNVTDQNKVTSYAFTNDDQEEIIVIYDPNGGFTYGGGHFNSPLGALVANPSATGLGTYGFTINYYKGATYPKGETHFNFNVGGFQYDALNFDYLSIAGYKAVFAGTGKILGGISGVNFTMYVIDGALDGTGVDKVRLKIYNKNTGQVYYDNEAGKSDAADPTTPVGLNSAVVIGGTSNTIVSARNQRVITTGPAGLSLKSYPNPSYNSFNVVVETSNITDKIVLKVTDILGREIEQRVITPNQTVILGASYRPGIYIVQVLQGDQTRELKLSKIPD